MTHMPQEEGTEMLEIKCSKSWAKAALDVHIRKYKTRGIADGEPDAGGIRPHEVWPTSCIFTMYTCNAA